MMRGTTTPGEREGNKEVDGGMGWRIKLRRKQYKGKDTKE